MLAGGLAQVVFLSAVRWPTPLRGQREATAAAYRELARIAAGPAVASTLPAASALDDAQSALASGSLFGDSALMTLRSLASEGLRLRVQITAIHALIERARAEGSRADARARRLRRVSARATAAALGAGARQSRARRPPTRALGSRRRGHRAGRAGGRTGRADARGHERAAPRRTPSRSGEPSNPSPARPSCAGSPRWPGSCVRSRPCPRRPAGAEACAPAGPIAAPIDPLARLQADFAQIRANVSMHSPAGRHAVRLAIVVPGAELIARELPLQRSYWMVVAAATVLRPEFGATFTRGSERALGTSLGVALAGALAVLLHPTGGVTVVIVGLLAWAGYALFPASFAIGFAFITTLTVFLLNAINPDTLSTAAARLLDTAVGGALGLIVFAAWPTWSRRPARTRWRTWSPLSAPISPQCRPRSSTAGRPRRTNAPARAAGAIGADQGRGDDCRLTQRSRRSPDRPDWSQGLRGDASADPGRSRVAPRCAGGPPTRADAGPGAAGRERRRAARARGEPDRGGQRRRRRHRGSRSPQRVLEFTRDRARTPDDLALVSALDEVVDAAGGLATLVGIDPADPPGMRSGAGTRSGASVAPGA